MRKSWRMRAAGGITSAMLAITALQPLANVPTRVFAAEYDSLRVSYNVFDTEQKRSHINNGSDDPCYVLVTLKDAEGEDTAWALKKIYPSRANQDPHEIIDYNVNPPVVVSTTYGYYQEELEFDEFYLMDETGSSMDQTVAEPKIDPEKKE